MPIKACSLLPGQSYLKPQLPLLSVLQPWTSFPFSNVPSFSHLAAILLVTLSGACSHLRFSHPLLFTLPVPPHDVSAEPPAPLM